MGRAERTQTGAISRSEHLAGQKRNEAASRLLQLGEEIIRAQLRDHIFKRRLLRFSERKLG